MIRTNFGRVVVHGGTVDNVAENECAHFSNRRVMNAGSNWYWKNAGTREPGAGGGGGGGVEIHE